jgi:hypothetical protein
MPEYRFTGWMKISRVDFFIEAPTLKEAKEKARNGDYDTSDDDACEIDDVYIEVSTGVENR